PTAIHEKGALRELGLDSPEFYGGMTSHIGFALNPAKYVHGLARAAESHGAKILENTPVTHTGEENGKHVLHTPNGRIIADKVIFATNGYSSEDVPKWLAHRYLPALSSIIVTRPMSGQELAAQGWTSHQMCADTRRLLHYFHLMPDGRMLFGMRGGTSAKGASERRIRQIIRGNFDRFFPAWRDVETPHFWSGFVCLTRPLVPFSGAIPGMPGAFAGYGYHGSGVSMGSYNGMLLASLAAGTKPAGPKPAFMEKAPGIFPPGRLRRGILPVTYAVLKQMDAF
ncbi:MAG: FAD-binding oxidoreductase, partial [Paracoccaceae bacterium]|nr:FAD-binding oxidoreductase [Paracoccaceae bacterium]